VACYNDELAIPIMYERLVGTFRKIAVDYEIIFVNDGSPDDCAGAILQNHGARSLRRRRHPFAQLPLPNGFFAAGWKWPPMMAVNCGTATCRIRPN
jgi:glycosyltransferase involved in cell wall biosynthesis